MENIIDTVYIRYDIDKEDNGQEFNRIKSWLNSEYSEGSKFSQIKGLFPEYKYKIKNLEVTLTGLHLYIRGSIATYFAGNNITSIDMQDMYNALDMLNDDLGNLIEIRQCIVRRLDIGINLPMSYKPDDYVTKIYDSTYNKKDVRYFNKTVVKGNKSRSVAVYNKTDEVNNKKNGKVNIPVPKNLLRFEVRIDGKHVFEKYLENKTPTLIDVFDSAYKFPKIIKDEYDKLDKEYDSFSSSISSTSDLYTYAFKIAGAEKLIAAINHSYNKGLLNYQNKYRITQTVKSAFKEHSSVVEASKKDLINELDSKIQEWYLEQIKF